MTKEIEKLAPRRNLPCLVLDFTRRARANKFTTEDGGGGGLGMVARNSRRSRDLPDGWGCGERVIFLTEILTGRPSGNSQLSYRRSGR